MTTRRDILKVAAASTAAIGLGLPAMTPAQAQAITNLDVFVPAAPGGGWDGTARAIEAAMRADGILSEFKFEHVGGAGGMVGLPRFINGKKGQGNAIMIGGMVMVGAGIANKSPVTIADVTPVARLTGEALVIVVPDASPFKSIGDLVNAFKANPKAVSWAGGSAGGADHILVGQLAKSVGVDPRQAAYVAFAGGGPAQAALLGNQVSAGVSGFGEFEEQIKAGKLRALAVSGEGTQSGVKSLKEQGVNVVLYNWRGVFAAPGVTPAQRDALVALIEKMVNGPAWKKTLETRGWDGIYLGGDAFGAFLKKDIADTGAILKDLGLAS
ncbi:MAG: Bug family tripartite tricarboxylate transporter substrate binding protein [Rhabdaerophilum sp.]